VKQAPLFAIGLIACLALVAGCASPGPEPAELKPFKAEIKPGVAWRAETGESGPYTFSPGILEGDFFVAGMEGKLQRLDGRRGRSVWKTDTRAPLSGGVGVGGGLALVGTTKGEVLAYTASDGRMKWRSRVSTEVLSAPVVVGDVVVVRSGDSRVFGLDAADGARRWEYIPTSASPLLLRGAFGLTVDSGVVYVGLPGGKLVAIRLDTGAVLWEVAVAQPKGDTELERVIDVVTAPVVEDGQACAVAYQGRIACFDSSRGTLSWARNASSVSGLATNAKAFFYVDDVGTVLAVERSSGGSLWKQSILSNRGVGPPGVVGTHVVVGDFEGFVHLFDQEDGRLAGRISTDGGPISSAPVAVGEGRLVVQTRKGGLYALTLRAAK